jgi:hypothetical protein
MENVLASEWDVSWLKWAQIEETGSKNVTIARVKTVPELDIAFGFCQVARVDKEVAVVCERLVVL